MGPESSPQSNITSPSRGSPPHPHAFIRLLRGPIDRGPGRATHIVPGSCACLLVPVAVVPHDGQLLAEQLVVDADLGQDVANDGNDIIVLGVKFVNLFFFIGFFIGSFIVLFIGLFISLLIGLFIVIY